MRRTPMQAGFSLPELLVAMAIMLLISGAAVSALLKMTAAQATIWNRTQMHSGIRGATEVLQQEVGQAGRIALPAVTTTSGTSAGAAGATVTIPVSSSAGMYVGMKLTIDTGSASNETDAAQETVKVTAIPSATSVTVQSLQTDLAGVVTGRVRAHNANAPVLALGAFGTGIIPPASSPSTYAPGGPTFTYANGSTGTVLKLYGDINADGNMVYIEYTCDTVGNNLYRNMMSWTLGTKPPVTAKDILLSNITDNPNGTPCFTYQTAMVGGNAYVTDVAITLTVRTQLIDPITKQYQTQTKALLNVSPRNTFNAWQMASLGIANRIQPIPPSITALLPPLP
ncbi:MAG TPA: type II secretion system protein [Vicinamibacterales bacterium]|nr:type II secretion system protein [Vicinamibacterales bacterium]